jgi:Zn-dependent membrane protease YugP
MLFFDPLFFVFALPAMLFALWAQYKVQSTFQKYSKERNMHGISGLEAARILMRNEGLDYLRVNQVSGNLTDFYNPSDKSINLSQGSSAPSVAALAIVAHELGHAKQDHEGYLWLRLRAGIVGVAQLGSNLGVILFFVGMIMGAAAGNELGWTIALAGVALFAGAVAFTLVTLPVEFNASSRAREMLMRNGLVSRQEMDGVSQMLNAAALTYVAAAAQAISQLLYFVLILLGGRRD